MVPPFEQTLITHTKGLFVSNILEEFALVILERKRFLKVCIKYSMFKLSLAIISPIM